jgi:hypothetical protein
MAHASIFRALLLLGLLVSAVLLIRFAIDFSNEMKWWLAGPFCVLVITALGVGIANVFGAPKSEPLTHSRAKSAMLLAVIPLGFLASSLDCTGLSLQGCSPFCTFVKLIWIPPIAVACAGSFFARKPVWFTAIALMSFVPLVPHCVCYNVANAWWIDHLGASPLCYGWGFVVSVIAVGALRKGVNLWASLVICFAIVAGSVAFFISHHYFHFPW